MSNRPLHILRAAPIKENPARVPAKPSLAAIVLWLLAMLVADFHSAAEAVAVGSVPFATSSPAGVHLVMSNYQFCRQAPCQWPTEAAYTRSISGPVDATDNPAKFIAVSPGNTVTWVYEDTAAPGGPQSCDFFGTPPYPDDRGLECVGHSVALEDGSPEGMTVGFLPARSGPVTITWVVPADAKPGSIVRYFCNVRDQSATVPGGIPHWMDGMTGGFRVVAAEAR